MVTSPLIFLIYGVLTSLGVLIGLAMLLRGVVLNDFTSPASDHTDSFECGYNASDFTSVDMLDLRVLLSLYLIFDTELWFLLLTSTSTHSSVLMLSLMLLVYFLYTALELYVML